MMTQSNIIKWAIPLILLPLLTLLQSLINCKKANRGRQFALPAVAGVFAVMAMVMFYLYTDKIDAWLETLYQSYPDYIAAKITLLNIVLMVTFLLVKCIACPIVSAKWKDHKMMEETSISFYEYNEVYDVWFLRKRWSNFRFIFSIFSQIGTVLAAMMIAVTWVQGEDASTWVYWFPCAALIVINEICHFLNGQTKEEFMHNVVGDEADSRSIANYYRMREIYEKIFPEPILTAHTGAEYSAKQGATNLLASLEESEDEIDNVVSRYYQTYDENLALDVDCIQASAQLLRRNSVIFLNPFYRDIGTYITLPLLQSLLKSKKCLVVAGRSSTARDAVSWLEVLLREYSHLRSMWRVKQLTRAEPDCEVGILDFQQLYAIDVLNANKEFLQEVDFVLLLEPSAMVSTGQVGLTILAEEAGRNGEPPVYCVCDRYTDAIVDTLSHLLHTNLTEVVAMPVPHCIYTGMLWDADGDYQRQTLFDKQTKFLGNGMEVAAVAIKNQVPKVVWHGETKAPLRDIKWIAGQQCATICRYMNLPAQQKNLYEKIEFSPNLWSAKASKEQFVIVEDEFCNMFNLLRAFLSRGEKQVFVNVLSENYLLRDYMRCNQQMFLANPNAVPSLTPAYAKTERNIVFKLLMLMVIRPVSELDVIRELELLGYQATDAFATFSMLLKRYTAVDGSVLTVKGVSDRGMIVGTCPTNFFSITPDVFHQHFAKSLKNAYYVIEEEKRNSQYIDAKLFGHITQTILPGQFVVYDGKYYQAKLISPENGVVLRRASDLYTGRRYYRQFRTYHFASMPTESLQYHRKTLGMEISISSCDFYVTTSGYLDMNDNHDLRLAKTVDFSGDPNVRHYDRYYKNKNVLQLKLPDTDENIRFTLCMLFEEMFHSIFPDAWQYLVASAKQPDAIDGMLTHMVYAMEGEVEEDVIYILEDSDMDLGLLDAVARSLPQMFEIIADFLDWHFEKMREKEAEDPVKSKKKIEAEAAEEKRRGLFLRMAERIRSLFGKKEETVAVPSTEQAEKARETEDSITGGRNPDSTSAQTADGEGKETKEYSLDPTAGAEAKDADLPTEAITETKDSASEVPQETGEYSFTLENDEPTQTETHIEAQAQMFSSKAVEEPHYQEDEPEAPEEDSDIVHSDGTDIFENEGMPENDLWLEESFKSIGLTPLKKTRYQRECYLKFGFDEIDSRLKIEDVRKYLHVRGFSNNTLTRARKSDLLQRDFIDCDPVNQCDFCGVPLTGISFDRMNDGRVRCNDCSSSAITTVDAFQELFYQILEMQKMFFGISIHVPIMLKMADARTIAKGAGSVFRPSVQVAPRVLGYAQRKNGAYFMMMENGSPRLATIDTMVHELTHIWQYLNWDDHKVAATYHMPHAPCTARARDIVYEGMAMWAAIQYLYLIGESYYAAQQEARTLARSDVYGAGFRLYCEQYPLSKDMSLVKYSPFQSFPPLEPQDVINASRSMCTEEKCKC